MGDKIQVTVPHLPPDMQEAHERYKEEARKRRERGIPEDADAVTGILVGDVMLFEVDDEEQ